MGAADIARTPVRGARIENIATAAYRIATDAPESDGTLEWNSTTLVTAHVAASGMQGFGYTYASRAAAVVIADTLAPLLAEREALDSAARWNEDRKSVV